MNARRILSGLLLCLLITTGASAKKFAKERDIDLSQYDFRSGDTDDSGNRGVFSFEKE